jgi:hypothetical protein
VGVGKIEGDHVKFILGYRKKPENIVAPAYI